MNNMIKKMRDICLSYRTITFVYGVFLFLYELKLVREVIADLHPLLLVWAGCVIGYQLIYCKKITLVKGYLGLSLCCISVVIAALVNYETGFVSNIKGCVLMLIPLLLFYPIFFIESKKMRERILVQTLLGASVVVFFSSTIALIMYFLRFGSVFSFKGTVQSIGVGFYNAADPTSGLLVKGLYADTNHAAVYALIFAAYSVTLYHACKNNLFQKEYWNKLGKCYAVLNLIVQICYFPLANSRGAWISFGVAGCVAGYLFLMRYWHKKQIKYQKIAAISCAVLGVIVCMFGVLLVRTVQSGVSLWIGKDVVLNMESDAVIESVCEETTESIQEFALPSPIVYGYIRKDTGKPRILWGEVENATEYRVYRSENGIDFGEVYTTKGKSYTNTSAGSGEAYYYKVKAFADDLESDYSEIVYLELQKGEGETTQTQNNKTDNFKKKNVKFGSGRIQIWSEVPQMLKIKPIFGTGTGVNNNQYYAQKYQVAQNKIAKGVAIHNSYFTLLLVCGVVGTSVFMEVFGLLLWNIFKKYILRNTGSVEIQDCAAVFILLLLLVQALFLSNLFTNMTAMYYVFLVIVGYLEVKSISK